MHFSCFREPKKMTSQIPESHQNWNVCELWLQITFQQPIDLTDGCSFSSPLQAALKPIPEVSPAQSLVAKAAKGQRPKTKWIWQIKFQVVPIYFFLSDFRVAGSRNESYWLQVSPAVVSPIRCTRVSGCELAHFKLSLLGLPNGSSRTPARATANTQPTVGTEMVFPARRFKSKSSVADPVN